MSKCWSWAIAVLLTPMVITALFRQRLLVCGVCGVGGVEEWRKEEGMSCILDSDGFQVPGIHIVIELCVIAF